MSKVYFTHISDAFTAELARIFTQQGYTVITQPEADAEYFIDTTDACAPGDDRRVGEGVDIDAAVDSFRLNVCQPLAKLQEVLPGMAGKRRICFINSRRSSINYSAETRGYGHNMAKAALNQILMVTKNGLVSQGYTFRLFDPMAGDVAPEKAAASAYVYFTRDRFDDGPDNPSRNDELNLLLRDALGREIPW